MRDTKSKIDLARDKGVKGRVIGEEQRETMLRATETLTLV